MTAQEVLNDQARKYEEARRIFIKNDKTLTEIERMHAEIGKMFAETEKARSESKWYLVVVVGAAFAAGGTIIGTLIKFMS
jgi:hypothetical protein